jgi:hypothetical protein
MDDLEFIDINNRLMNKQTLDFLYEYKYLCITYKRIISDSIEGNSAKIYLANNEIIERHFKNLEEVITNKKGDYYV